MLSREYEEKKSSNIVFITPFLKCGYCETPVQVFSVKRTSGSFPKCDA